MTFLRDLETHKHCFACGEENIDGLNLRFEQSTDSLICKVLPDAKFQSYSGIVHGGILALIADATMVNLVHKQFGGQPLTCSLEMRYRLPVSVGEALSARARIEQSKHHMVWVNCTVSVGSQVRVEAYGTFKVGQPVAAGETGLNGEIR